MSLLAALLRRKTPEPVFDPKPGETHEKPARPYRVLHANLPFFSDSECRNRVRGASLVVLRCEDPMQKHRPVECIPTRKEYARDQILKWDINHKMQWDEAWYVNPDNGKKEEAWARAVEFIGVVFKAH